MAAYLDEEVGACDAAGGARAGVDVGRKVCRARGLELDAVAGSEEGLRVAERRLFLVVTFDRLDRGFPYRLVVARVQTERGVAAVGDALPDGGINARIKKGKALCRSRVARSGGAQVSKVRSLLVLNARNKSGVTGHVGCRRRCQLRIRHDKGVIRRSQRCSRRLLERRDWRRGRNGSLHSALLMIRRGSAGCDEHVRRGRSMSRALRRRCIRLINLSNFSKKRTRKQNYTYRQ